MVSLIAIHTVQYLSGGKPATALPGVRFEMPASEVDSLVRRGAAKHADPADAVASQPAVAAATVSAPVADATPANPAPVEPETAPLDAEAVLSEVQPETVAEDAPAAPKRTRKAKAE